MANIVAKVGDLEPEDPQFSDPFAKSWDELKEYRGIQTNFKRRTSRVVKGYMEDSKGRPTGKDDAGAKAILLMLSNHLMIL